MRIAWFHSHLLHVNSGGTRFVLDYTEALQRNHGHQITLFCDVASREAVAQVEQAGMKLVQLDRESTNSPTYWLTLPAGFAGQELNWKRFCRIMILLSTACFR